MIVETTSIRYKSVNLDHEDLRYLLEHVCYPDFLQAYGTICVAVICLRNEPHQHEAYEYEGEAYIAIALDYPTVAGLSYEEMTVICKNKLLEYMGTLQDLPVRELV